MFGTTEMGCKRNYSFVLGFEEEGNKLGQDVVLKMNGVVLVRVILKKFRFPLGLSKCNLTLHFEIEGCLQT